MSESKPAAPHGARVVQFAMKQQLRAEAAHRARSGRDRRR